MAGIRSRSLIHRLYRSSDTQLKECIAGDSCHKDMEISHNAWRPPPSNLTLDKSTSTTSESGSTRKLSNTKG